MRHGGDLDEAARLYGAPPGGWLDLSTGVNPRPYPTGDPAHWSAGLRRLPSPRELDALLGAARAAYGVGDAVAIAAAPGTEILIRALPHLIAGTLSVVDTSYRSYRESFAAHGRFAGSADLSSLTGEPDQSLVAVNPNNPDGRTTSPAELLAIGRGRAPGRMLIIDEAYAEPEPNTSVVPHLRGKEPVLVLKSFGKFFGLPGLRLGFAIGPETIVDKVKARLGDWPVSAAAISIGMTALADEAWRTETRHWLGNMAQSLDGVLRSSGLKLAGGCRLFRVARADHAAGLHASLARQGVWTRIFQDRPGLMRFGLPADRAGLERLGEALRLA